MTASPERLFKLAHLAGLLADQVLDAQIMNRLIPEKNIRVLLRTAFLLDEYDVPLPSLLQPIIHAATRGLHAMRPDLGRGHHPRAIPDRLYGRNKFQILWTFYIVIVSS